MKRNLIILLCCTVMAACGNRSSKSENDLKANHLPAVVDAKIVILEEEGADIIDSTETIRNLGEGFKWSEGPLYIADGEYLIFSDIPNNRIMKWKEGKGVSVYLEPAGFTGSGVIPKKEPGSNGLLLDNKGSLVLCQHGDRRIARMVTPVSHPKPEFETVVDKFTGKRLNSPNDAVYHSDGSLYFTDPTYGLDGSEDDTARELKIQGVYRVTPDGKADLVTSEFKWPNGIALTKDGKFLLVAHSDPENMVWMKYELGADGLSKNKSIFYKVSSTEKDKPGLPDGMKVAKNGYLFASGPGGIWIFNPSGKPVARIYTNQLTSNCGLSSDEKTLFMTCDDFLYSVKLK